jgi:hypothetical protein
MLVDHDCIDEERPLHGGYDLGAYEYNGAKMDSDRDYHGGWVGVAAFAQSP